MLRLAVQTVRPVMKVWKEESELEGTKPWFQVYRVRSLCCPAVYLLATTADPITQSRGGQTFHCIPFLQIKGSNNRVRFDRFP